MVARRMLLIVAILMGITALTAGLAAPPARRSPVTPSPSATGVARGDAAPVRRTLRAGRPTRTVAVAEGDHLILTVRVDALDSVEVVGLDQLVAVSPDTPAVFDLLADRPGLYPVVLGTGGRRVGALRVTPPKD